MIIDGEKMLHSVEQATQSIGLFLNVAKTKYISINPSTQDTLKTLDGSSLEEVHDFKYLGAYCETERDINTRIAQGWSALNKLSKIWKSKISSKTKVQLFQSTIESILLYSCESWSLTKAQEKRIDGCYTRMLRKVKNIW